MSTAAERARVAIAQRASEVPAAVDFDQIELLPGLTTKDVYTLVLQAEALENCAPQAFQAIEVGPT